MYVGGTDGVLYAYDAKRQHELHDGNLQGSAARCGDLVLSEDPSESSPTLANGYVYIGTLYGSMYMFDETNGYDGRNPSCRTTWAGQNCHWEWETSVPLAACIHRPPWPTDWCT